MSYQPEEFNLVHLEIARQDPSPSPNPAPSQLGHQLESLATASRNLEGALQREREYSRQLRDYINNMITRFNSLQRVEKEQARELQELRAGMKDSLRRVSELTTDLAKVRSELERYRTAWAEVVSHEQRAQATLARADAVQKRVVELEASFKAIEQKYLSEKSQRERAESHVSVHRAELQNALVRLHSADARFNDMTRELESLHAIRKNHQQELARAVEEARVNAEAAIVRQYDQMSRELQAERARVHQLMTEREKEKENHRQEAEEGYRRELSRVRGELEAHFTNERLAIEAKGEEAISHEIQDREKIITSLTEALKSAREELSRSRGEVVAVEQGSRALEIECLRLKGDLSQAAREAEEEKGRRLRLERDFAATTRRVDLLRGECQLLQELLLADKQELSQVIDSFSAAWDLGNGRAGEDPFEQAVAALMGHLGGRARIRVGRASLVESNPGTPGRIGSVDAQGERLEPDGNRH